LFITTYIEKHCTRPLKLSREYSNFAYFGVIILYCTVRLSNITTACTLSQRP